MKDEETAIGEAYTEWMHNNLAAKYPKAATCKIKIHDKIGRLIDENGATMGTFRADRDFFGVIGAVMCVLDPRIEQEPRGLSAPLVKLWRGVKNKIYVWRARA